MDEKPKTTRKKPTPKPAPVPATLMRGPDGNLYAIPHTALQAYKVPEAGVPQVESMMEQDTDITHVKDAAPLLTAFFLIGSR